MQFLICTSTCILDPWLTKIRNSHNSQIIYYNTNSTKAQNSDHKIQAFKLKLSKNSLAHSLSVSAYSDYWIKVKLEMPKWVKQCKSNERELKN